MRKYNRLAYHNVATLRRSEMSAEYVCNILDISESGVRFTADYAFPIGAQYLFSVLRCGRSGMFKVQCEIVWQQRIEHGYMYGAKLFAPDGSESMELEFELDYIKQAQRG